MYLLKIAQALTSRRYRSPDLFSAALKSVTSNQKRRQKSNVLLSLELLKTKQTEIYIDRLDNPGLFILERPLDPGGVLLPYMGYIGMCRAPGMCRCEG